MTSFVAGSASKPLADSARYSLSCVVITFSISELALASRRMTAFSKIVGSGREEALAFSSEPVDASLSWFPVSAFPEEGVEGC